MNHEIIIPADVPKDIEKEFIRNYESITEKTGNLVLFAGDQKIEHLNKDFHNLDVHPDAHSPEHLFNIANEGHIGAFATQFGLIIRYGRQFPDINYIVKLNSKTDIIPRGQQDPLSKLLWTVEDVIDVKICSKLPIRGIGFTVYLGSQYESSMLAQAAQAIHRAHQHGLVSIIWMYPRGKNIPNEKNPDLIAGAAGVAACLGADFVKLNPPQGPDSTTRAKLIKQAVAAAGNTKVICSGGPIKNKKDFLQELHDQIHIGGTAGCATGRNIFQHSTAKAIAMTQSIAAIVFDGQDAP